MSRFIKFTNFLLNTNDIHKILITPNKYFIQIAGKKKDGFLTETIEVCEKNHSIDYKILSNWIQKK